MNQDFSRTIAINPSAAQLVGECIKQKPRILILGAGGWFGKTTLSLLDVDEGQLMLIGQTRREIMVNGRAFLIEQWESEIVSEFEPEIVLDFAFLTRDHLPLLGSAEFSRVNTMLANRVTALVSLPSVAKILTVSSGAAVPGQPLGNPTQLGLYGSLKFQMERDLVGAASSNNKKLVIARAWSVSGGFVGASSSLAFSSFVRGALVNKNVDVNAKSLVYRRYCAAEDFISVSLWGLANGVFDEIDSGGNLVEVGELAHAIAARVGGSTVTFRTEKRELQEPNSYHSDNKGWSRYTSESGLEPLTIEEQIDNVVAALSDQISL